MPQTIRLLAFLSLLAAVITPSAHAAVPQDQQVTCESSWPENVHPQDDNIYKLSSRTLSRGRIEWYGRFKMYSPRGNETACNIRQILFSTGHLVNEIPLGSPNGPIITLVVQHGFFHCRAKDMVVEPHFAPQTNGNTTFYTVQAQDGDIYKSGSYYAKISVIGRPLP